MWMKFVFCLFLVSDLFLLNCLVRAITAFPFWTLATFQVCFSVLDSWTNWTNSGTKCFTRIWNYIYILYIYRVSQEECARLREGVPYVKVYRYNPKHLYPKLNCYGDSGRRKWGLLAFPNTATCTADVSRESVDDLESGMHGSWKRHVKCLEP